MNPQDSQIQRVIVSMSVICAGGANRLRRMLTGVSAGRERVARGDGDGRGGGADEPLELGPARSTSGGISTTTSPSGRMIAPRARASSVTRWPMRALGSGSSAQLDADHEAAPAHLAPRRASGAIGSEQLAEQLDLRLQALERALLLEDVERGERRGAGERVAGVGVAVEEGADSSWRAEEALVDRARSRASPPAAGSRR